MENTTTQPITNTIKNNIVTVNGTPLSTKDFPKIDLDQEVISEIRFSPLNNKDPQQLLDALYYMWDAFDRALMPYFLIHKTAEDAMKNRDLTGNKVTLGVRKMEWLGGSRRILEAFTGTPLTESDELVTFEHKGVPIELHLYDDHNCIIQTDMIRYRYEEFKVPNPYSEFEEVYG